jgi:hypothetical protein
MIDSFLLYVTRGSSSYQLLFLSIFDLEAVEDQFKATNLYVDTWVHLALKNY